VSADGVVLNFRDRGVLRVPAAFAYRSELVNGLDALARAVFDIYRG